MKKKILALLYDIKYMYSFMERLPMHTRLEEEHIFLLIFFSQVPKNLLLSDTVSDFCKD